MFGYHIIIYILWIIVGLTLSISFSHAGYISISPTSQTLTLWNPYQFQIYLHTEGQEETVASDIKFFLYGLSFVWFTSMSGFDNTIYIWTGLSTTWSHISQTYYYINTYQNSFVNHISGNIAIGNITLVPKVWYTTGAIIFYDLLENNEDSNISVWIQPWVWWYPMKYIDTLSHVINGVYSIIASTPSGGWGWSITRDDCLIPSALYCANEFNEDYSTSFYDNTCCGTIETGHESSTTCNTFDSPYNEEITDAFSRWYEMNITNKCPITTARLEQSLTRIEAAKMLSMFSIQVIWIYPDTNKTSCEQYNDIANVSTDLKFFAKIACQLNIMGLEENGTTPQKSFYPWYLVDRAQFGTMLSRLVYGDKYNIYAWDEDTYEWYQKHLIALNEDNIMKKIQNPLLIEERARILLMLKRIYDQNLVERYRLLAPAHNGALVLLANIR